LSAVKVISGVATAVVIFIALGLDYVTETPWPFCVFILFVLLAAQWEFHTMPTSRGIYPLRILGLLLGLVYLAFAFMGPYSSQSVSAGGSAALTWWHGDLAHYWERMGSLVVVIAVVVPFVYFLLVRKREHAFESSMATTFGLIYVIFLGSYMLKIRFQSLEYALLFVCTAKACDIGGYFTGSTLGRHKMHPESPNKTIEGSIGGVVLGTAIAVLVTRLFLAESFPVYLAVIYGVLVCAASQIGDLGESMIKRRCGVKDSGRLIPGSGGMLDFADCLLFSAPVAYYFVSFAVA
jgi:phosphatidate cytidylyltransferase